MTHDMQLQDSNALQRKPFHVWRSCKRWVIAVSAACQAGGLVIASVSSEEQGFAVMGIGFLIALIAPFFLAKYQPSKGTASHPSMGWRLAEQYLEVILKSIAVSGILVLLAALASIGWEYLDAWLNRGP